MCFFVLGQPVEIAFITTAIFVYYKPEYFSEILFAIYAAVLSELIIQNREQY